ncbi:repressor LexA [Devosia crocina]|uniref:Repressor LexA n=1 Tax=Devosia crocina TaxID=429728 RepID=A0A1I7NF77_9HYPH|nr:LexA family transcriptional regulator [Devosia crocina]SFV33253.1 repressor LexA [Devosia crocina]
MANRLKQLREARGWTHQQAADHMGVSRSQFIKLERGERRLTEQYIDQASSAFAVPPAEIIEDQTEHRIVPLMGEIGAGAEISPDYEQVPEGGLEQIEVPFYLPDDMVAFRVKGDSMLPRYDEGDVIVVWREQRRATSSFLGEEVAVRTRSGNRYLKTLQRAGARGYNLASWNARLIENVEIEWIGEIYVTIRAAQLRRTFKAALA